MTAEPAIALEVPAQSGQRPRALSPSRAADFMHCPLLYRFRTIDRLPEPPDAMATRGTVVHAVLERLFDLAPEERTLDAAAAMLKPEWESLLAAEPYHAGLYESDDGTAVTEWLTSAEQLLATYFD